MIFQVIRKGTGPIEHITHKNVAQAIQIGEADDTIIRITRVSTNEIVYISPEDPMYLENHSPDKVPTPDHANRPYGPSSKSHKKMQ